MRIGIVGGSIAGCSAAILLLKEGHDVMVFERSNKTLVGRGGGIGTTTSLLEQISSEGLIGKDFSSFPIKKMSFIGKTENQEPFGRTAWEMPMDFEVFQWNELWSNLRKRVPDENYLAGKKVVDAKSLGEERVQLIIDDDTTHEFDLVLFADGYNSMGRNIIFPHSTLKYRGYVLWRGLLPELDVDGDCAIDDRILRLSYQGEPGHNVVYFIPDQDGSIEEGNRVFNWAAYINVPPEDLEDIMTDSTGRLRKGTVPPGRLSKSAQLRLRSFLSLHIPDYYAEVINQTEDSYIQVIYTLDLNDYYKGRMCLIGDAGMVVQPFTGSGVFKGYSNVTELIACLKAEDDVDSALSKWSEQQVISGKKLLALGEQMEKAFIWEQPDFASISTVSAQEWWKESVTFPDNFNYSKEQD